MPMQSGSSGPTSKPARHGVARAISKSGQGSRTQAAEWVRSGRVSVNGRVVSDPEFPVRIGVDRIRIEGSELVAAERVVLMLNKPRGLVTSTRDEQGRDTVYRCLEGADLPWLAPVGRLDKASEGLLLMCNDPEWAARITDPVDGPDKTYRVQVDCIPDAALLAKLKHGAFDDGQWLSAKSVLLLRAGTRNAWLEIVLDEGKNRQIRRLLSVFGIGVLRLIRVAIGSLVLGDLPKGQWRRLSEEQVLSLAPASSASQR